MREVKSDLDIIEKNLDIVMSIEGQITRDEARVLMGMASSVQCDQVIVEIGSYRGRSSVALALGSIMNNCNRVYAIDPHDEFVGVLGGLFGPDDQAELYKNIVKTDVGNVVSVISIPSVNASKCWPSKNIGFLWIDGDHRYNSVRSDFEAWQPFVAVNGIIAFHDSNIDGVKLLIDELIQTNIIRQLGVVDSLSWFAILPHCS